MRAGPGTPALGSLWVSAGGCVSAGAEALDEVDAALRGDGSTPESVAGVQDGRMGSVAFVRVPEGTGRVLGVPSDAPFQRWGALHVVCREGVPVRRRPMGHVTVDSATLVVLDEAAWHAPRVEPALCDVHVWGRDAAAVAGRLGLPALPGEGALFGLEDLSVADASAEAARILAAKRFWHGVRCEACPHTWSHLCMRAAREGRTKVALGETTAAVVGLHQDGTWPVYAVEDAAGTILGVTLVLEQHERVD